jgi:hypothetical protein
MFSAIWKIDSLTEPADGGRIRTIPSHASYLLATALLGVTLSISASAENFSSVAVFGYNYSGIVPSSAVVPYSSTASSLDLGNDALFQASLPGAAAGGLPANGMLGYTSGSNSYDFALGPYGGLNLLRVDPSGTLSLADPTAYSTIAVLGFSTQNNSLGAIEMVGDVTLHFSDDSSSVYSDAVDLSDWFATNPGNANKATSAAGGLINIGAANAAAAFEPTAGGPDFYVSDIDLTAGDAAKTLTSVTFDDFPDGGNGFQFVMALDGGTGPVSTVPEPPTWSLVALAMLVLFGIRAARLRRAHACELR